ncbi:MAG: hypothetical protein GY949_21570, partial [Gammaproteobacteria bacterium]|nr:hypothetical protein [Gammaproteobacteria bacterium]
MGRVVQLRQDYDGDMRRRLARDSSDSDHAAKLKRGAPLRILVTRRTERDRAIDVQYLLASMGHLRLQNFTGRIGSETIAAVKAFQKANDLTQTGKFNDTLIAQVYDAAGKEEPPEGRLLADAVEAEVEAFIAAHADLVDDG